MAEGHDQGEQKRRVQERQVWPIGYEHGGRWVHLTPRRPALGGSQRDLNVIPEHGARQKSGESRDGEPHDDQPESEDQPIVAHTALTQEPRVASLLAAQPIARGGFSSSTLMTLSIFLVSATANWRMLRELMG
jgi:hypothetical protein